MSRTLGRDLRDACQWRLLLLWLVALTLPTALAVWPLWRALAGSLDHALNVDALARQFDIVTMLEAASGWRAAGDAPASGLVVALATTLLLSPWLSGLALTAAEAEPARPPGFAALMRGGFAWYARLGRLLLWAVVPLAIVGGIGAGMRFAVDHWAEHAILASDVDRWRAVAWTLTGVLLVACHASLDAGRVRLAVEPQRTSAVRAWWRGVRGIWRQPVASLVRYLVPTVLGLLIAALLGAARLRLPPVGWVGFVEAWLVTQAIVVALAWARCARLLALRSLARQATVSAG